MKRAAQFTVVINELRRRGLSDIRRRGIFEEGSSEKKKIVVELYQHGVKIKVLCRGFYGMNCIYTGFIDCAAQEERRNLVIDHAISNYNSIM